jgi:hypothetical protein
VRLNLVIFLARAEFAHDFKSLAGNRGASNQRVSARRLAVFGPLGEKFERRDLGFLETVAGWAPLDVGSMPDACGFPHAARPRSADPWGVLEACSNIPMGIGSKYRWRAPNPDPLAGPAQMNLADHVSAPDYTELRPLRRPETAMRLQSVVAGPRGSPSLVRAHSSAVSASASSSPSQQPRL